MFNYLKLHQISKKKGCAILNAIENEELDTDSYTNFMKIEKDKIHFESDIQERKKRNKDFGKMIKNTKKQRRNNKF